MEGGHVRHASEMDRAAYAKTVPIKEALTLLEASNDPVRSINEFRADVAEKRDPAAYLSSSWDVFDPYGRNLRTYRTTVAEISDLVDETFARLR